MRLGKKVLEILNKDPGIAVKKSALLSISSNIITHRNKVCKLQVYGVITLEKYIFIKLKENVWPSSESKINKVIRHKVFRDRRFLALQSVKNKIKLMRTYRVEKFFSESWRAIQAFSVTCISSIFWKILAIELIMNSRSSSLKGLDGKAFWFIAEQPVTKISGFHYFKKEINFIKRDLSLKKGKTDQLKYRKGHFFSVLEKRRCWLKSKDLCAQKYLSTIKKRLKYILRDPLKVAIMDRRIRIQYNRRLCFSILNELKLQNLFKYKAMPIKIISYQKTKGDLRFLGIPTVFDRCVHMLFKLVMEAYLEPLGDPNSFGYRPGRCCNQAVAEVITRLCSNKCKFFDGVKWVNKVSSVMLLRFKIDMFIIKRDLSDFFYKLSHQWLINNTPMPLGLDRVLFEVIKAPWMHPKKGLIVINSGIPVGGILSTLLMNWALDGLEDLIKDVASFYKKSEFVRIFSKIRKKNLSNFVWIVRYLDIFIVGIPICFSIILLFKKLKVFFGERSLQIILEKVKIMKIFSGIKFDFLGWTFHFRSFFKVNGLSKLLKLQGIPFSSYIRFFVYPSIKSIIKFKIKIKLWTHLVKVNYSIFSIVKKLTCIILEWHNYFFLATSRNLRRCLDQYIIKRCKMFLFKKYRGKYGVYLQKHLKLNNKWYPLYIKCYSERLFSLPKLSELVAVPFTRLLNIENVWNNSYLVNNIFYIKKFLLILKLKKEIKTLLYYKQQGVCPLCLKTLNLNIGGFIEFMLFNNFVSVESQFFIVLLKYSVDVMGIWGSILYFDLVIDYGIPRFFGVRSQAIYKILYSVENLWLVHRSCYNYKIRLWDCFLFQEYNKKLKTIILDVLSWCKSKVCYLSSNLGLLEFDEVSQRRIKLSALLKVIKEYILEKSQYKYKGDYIKYQKFCKLSRILSKSLYFIIKKIFRYRYYFLEDRVNQKGFLSHRLEALKSRLNKKSFHFRNWKK